MQSVLLWFTGLFVLIGTGFGRDQAEAQKIFNRLYSEADTAKVLYQIDFSELKDGQDPLKWLASKGFDSKFANKIQMEAKGGALYMRANSDALSVFGVQTSPLKAGRLRITWGVNRYSKSDWGAEDRNSSIMLSPGFGTETYSSGSIMIPKAPYFIGMFLDDKARENQFFTGKYFVKTGRYLCLKSGSRPGESLVSTVDLPAAFQKAFGLEMKPVSGFSITVNSKGGSEAFLRKIEFLE